MARGVDGRNLVSKVISDKQSSTEMHRCSARCTTSLLSWQNPEIWCDSCFYNNPALRNCTSRDGVPCTGFKCSITQKSLKNCSSGGTAEIRPDSIAVKTRFAFRKTTYFELQGFAVCTIVSSKDDDFLCCCVVTMLRPALVRIPS